jgi:hypothetical protein
MNAVSEARIKERRGSILGIRDGSDWTQHTGPTPGETCCSAITYDSARREVVSHISGATWVFGP